MANNVTMSFANIIKIKGYYLFYGNILKMKKLGFGKEIDFPTTTAIPTIQKKLRENGSAPAMIETNEERSFFLIDIPCHPDFVGDDLSQVVSQVEHTDNNDFNKILSQVVSQVKGADLEQESQGQVPLTRRNDIILNKVNTKMI